MEWLKTSFLVFILFIFTVNNVNSYPADVIALLSGNTELSSTEESYVKNTTDSIENTTLSGNDTSTVENVKHNEYGIFTNMTREERMNWKPICDLVVQLEELYKVKTDSSKSCVERSEEVEILHKQKQAADAERNRRSSLSDNYHSKSDDHSSSSEGLSKYWIYGIAILIVLAFVSIGCIWRCVATRKRRRRRGNPMHPVYNNNTNQYNNAHQFANVQLDDNLVQKNPAAEKTAPRSPATALSSEVAVEIGMDKKTKTEVSSSNVEENNN